MVYTELTIVLGTVVTVKQLEQLGFEVEHDELSESRNELSESRKDRKEDPERGYVERSGAAWEKLRGVGLDIFSFPCHSDSRGKLFILGVVLHTYYRKLHYCDKGSCKKINRAVCNDCIGITNNGHYDVQKIIDEPTPVNLRRICFNCYADNRVDMGMKRGDRDANVRSCDTCGIEPVTCRTPRESLEMDHRVSNIKNMTNRIRATRQPVKLYYMVDDCLSCT